MIRSQSEVVGHLWQDYFQVHVLVFTINPDFSDIKDLEAFKKALDALNVAKAVNIGNVEVRQRESPWLRISTVECGTDRKERLMVQSQFLNFLYDVIDMIEITDMEDTHLRDISGVRTDPG